MCARGIRLALWMLCAACFGSPARGDDLPIRQMPVRWNGGAPYVQLTAKGFANSALHDKLKSGLPQTILTRVYAYDARGGAPLAVTFHSCRIAYDLWEDVYRVQLQTTSEDRPLLLRSAAAVIDTCLEASGIPVGRRADYAAQQGRPVYFSVLIELNPMSPDMVQRIRSWLSRSGGSRGLQRQEAFFGSFVSIFVNRRIGDAERSLRYRSPRLKVP